MRSFPTAQARRLWRVLVRSRRHVLSLQNWKTRVVFWAGAVATGATAALFASGATLANDLYHRVIAISHWLPYLISPLGLVVALWATRRFFSGAEGSGIPQTIAVLGYADWQRRARLLSPRIAIGKLLLTTLGLGVGASIGREGPSVHVGASIMYGVGRLARFPRHDLERGLILAGGAAGVAAAFNTPIAGIIFAIEEMSRSFEERTSGTMIIAVILAGMTALAIKGNYTYFGTTQAAIAASAWPAVLVYGILGGLFGGLFSATLIAGTRRIAPLVARYPYRVALGCGLAIALLGTLSGYTTFGTGYDEAKGILVGANQAGAMFPVYKMLATIASYLSGIPGGIFAPSLAVGAGMGADVAPLFPKIPLAAAVVLGMVSYFSGVVQTPITAFVIVMEITDNHEMTFALMAASFIAYGVSQLICREPIYRALAQRFAESDAAPGGASPTARDTRA